jgi:GNAT superfamily N-acetyltransferase
MVSYVVRKATPKDALAVNTLLSEWFDWTPKAGRLGSVRRAIGNGEVLVAQSGSRVVGFIHYVRHEDVIDGAPNSFISAFYVSLRWRGKGIGSLLLTRAISESLSRGDVGMQASTTRANAMRLYQKHHFKQTIGDMSEVFLELDVDEYRNAKAQMPRVNSDKIP